MEVIHIMMNNPYSGSGNYPPFGQMQTGYNYPPMGQMQTGYNFPPSIPSGGMLQGGNPAAPQQQFNTTSQLPLEASYIENILRLNLGKPATIYMTFENNSEWNAKIFKGNLEAAGRDHIIISDPQTGIRTLLLMVNLDYITFNEELNYAYPFS
jgi:spore germination protein Q